MLHEKALEPRVQRDNYAVRFTPVEDFVVRHGIEGFRKFQTGHVDLLSVTPKDWSVRSCVSTDGE